jgi:hypothetical protein
MPETSVKDFGGRLIFASDELVCCLRTVSPRRCIERIFSGNTGLLPTPARIEAPRAGRARSIFSAVTRAVSQARAMHHCYRAL